MNATQQYQALANVKSLKRMRDVTTRLEQEYVAVVGHVLPSFVKDNAAERFKVNGTAYLRDICLSMANKVIEAQSAYAAPHTLSRHTPNADEIERREHHEDITSRVVRIIRGDQT